MNRRNFIKNLSFLGGGALIAPRYVFASQDNQSETHPNAARAKKTERWNLNWLNISQFTSQGNDINFSFDATSKKDPERTDGKEYATGSGQLTHTRMSLVDNDQGPIGTDTADVRAQIDIKFASRNPKDENYKPGNENYADVKIIINTRHKPESINALSYIRRLFGVQPDPILETEPYDVEEMILEGKGILVTLNGETEGRRQGIANDIKNDTQILLKDTDDFGKRAFKINFHRSYREVIPTDGLKQLPAIRETLIPA